MVPLWEWDEVTLSWKLSLSLATLRQTKVKHVTCWLLTRHTLFIPTEKWFFPWFETLGKVSILHPSLIVIMSGTALGVTWSPSQGSRERGKPESWCDSKSVVKTWTLPSVSAGEKERSGWRRWSCGRGEGKQTGLSGTLTFLPSIMLPVCQR